jgi:hypothetical protein
VRREPPPARAHAADTRKHEVRASAAPAIAATWCVRCPHAPAAAAYAEPQSHARPQRVAAATHSSTTSSSSTNITRCRARGWPGLLQTATNAHCRPPTTQHAHALAHMTAWRPQFSAALLLTRCCLQRCGARAGWWGAVQPMLTGVACRNLPLAARIGVARASPHGRLLQLSLMATARCGPALPLVRLNSAARSPYHSAAGWWLWLCALQPRPAVFARRARVAPMRVSSAPRLRWCVLWWWSVVRTCLC